MSSFVYKNESLENYDSYETDVARYAGYMKRSGGDTGWFEELGQGIVQGFFNGSFI